MAQGNELCCVGLAPWRAMRHRQLPSVRRALTRRSSHVFWASMKLSRGHQASVWSVGREVWAGISHPKALHLRPPSSQVVAQTIKLLPVARDGGVPLRRNAYERIGAFADEPLLHRDEASLLQPRQMRGEIAFAQTSEAQQEEKIGALASVQGGEDSQPRGLMHELIEVGELLKGPI